MRCSVGGKGGKGCVRLSWYQYLLAAQPSRAQQPAVASEISSLTSVPGREYQEVPSRVSSKGGEHMDRRSKAGNSLPLYAILAVVLAAVQWPHPAEAFHIQGITIVPTSINRATRTVTVNIVEQTTGVGTAHTDAGVAWGDAVTSNRAWTSTTGAGPKFYHVNGVSHVYPDLTTRTITVTSDCCNTTLGYDFDTQVVDLGCTDSPMLLCNASAAKAQLQIKNDTGDDTKDKLKFKWLNGNTTFDDPTGT